MATTAIWAAAWLCKDVIALTVGLQLPSGNAFLAPKLEDAGEGLVQMLLVSIAKPCHILAQLQKQGFTTVS